LGTGETQAVIVAPGLGFRNRKGATLAPWPGITQGKKVRVFMGVRVRERPPGSGRWWVFVTHHGKRKAKSVGDRKTALEVARKIEAKLTLGDFKIEKPERQMRPSRSTARKWLALIGDMRKETTYERYENILRLHLNPKIGSKRLDEITRETSATSC